MQSITFGSFARGTRMVGMCRFGEWFVFQRLAVKQANELLWGVRARGVGEIC